MLICVLSVFAPNCAARADDFEPVASILTHRCLRCHNDVDRKGDLALHTAEDLAAQGLVDPRNPGNSRFMQAVTPESSAPPSMPKDGNPLTPTELLALSRWIESGAQWPEGRRLDDPIVSDFDWWSLKPIERPAVPEFDRPSAEQAWIRTPVDAFIIAALKERGLSHSAEADKRTLIRRVTYDLTGLPPAPEEVRDFLHDSDPLAYERVVDRLLASPRYGERWARHWLDVVKYADTCGYDKDKLRPNAWPYRDYVIRSFNEDKPYARFVEEQIAGDVLFPGSADGLLALGFIAAGPWDFIGHVEVPESKIDGQEARNLDRDDMVSNTLNTFCSVTIQCARCHNHKFDPFTQEHYYGLQAVFAAVDRADRPYEVDAKTEQQRELLTSRLKELREQLGRSPQNPELTAELARIEQERNSLPPHKLVYAASVDFEPQGQFKPTRGTPRVIKVLHRGNVLQPQEVAPPGALPLTPGEIPAFSLDEQATEGERRAALARWITRDDHPLTWRSIANRVWQYHFGRGIVETPNDFGRMGQLPTHPELLDWLAAEFRDKGRSFKHLHRLIVTSAVYRQASDGNESNARIDSENRFRWKMSRRRLTAEEIRDTVLAVSGRLNPELGGPGFFLFELERTEHSPHYEYHKFDPDDARSHRRAVYRFIVRSQPDPYMTTLDCADSSQSTPRRDETLTSLQALSLLNNRFNLIMAAHFASRLESESSRLEEQISRAMTLVAGRAPTADESRQLIAYASTHGLPNLCRLLFNLSEMVYVD